MINHQHIQSREDSQLPQRIKQSQDIAHERKETIINNKKENVFRSREEKSITRSKFDTGEAFKNVAYSYEDCMFEFDEYDSDFMFSSDGFFLSLEDK